MYNSLMEQNTLIVHTSTTMFYLFIYLMKTCWRKIFTFKKSAGAELCVVCVCCLHGHGIVCFVVTVGAELCVYVNSGIFMYPLGGLFQE